MKKALFFIGCLSISSAIFSYPYRFTRLIKTNQSTGEIEKTVDLIFDAHKNLPDPISEDKIDTSELVVMDSEYKMVFLKKHSNTERLLVSTLIKMSEDIQRSPIAIFWEGPITDIIAITKQELFGIAEFRGSACWYIQQRLRTNQRSDFYNIDIIRFYVFGASRGKEISNEIIENVEAKIQNLLVMITDPVLKKMAKEIWPEIKNNICGPDRDHLISLTDFEALLHVFFVPQKHIILYAGGSHCLNILNTLQKSPLDFKVVVDVGSEAEYYPNPFIGAASNFAPLTPETCNLLQEELCVSQKTQLIKRDFLNEIKELFNQQNISEDELLKKLIEYNEIAKKHYVILAQAEIGRFSFLERAVLKGFASIIDFLVHSGAKTSKHIYKEAQEKGLSLEILELLKV